MKDLPPGFTIDTAAPAQGALPNGFVLDEAPKPGKLESGIRGYLQGGSLGYGDEIQGGIAAAVAKLFGGDATKDTSFTDLYREGRDQVRKEDSAAEKANPGTYTTAQIGSSLLTPIPGKQLAEGKIADAIIKGGLLGGTYGGGVSNADLTKGEVGKFTEDVGSNALFGGAAGGVLQAGATAAPAVAEKAKGIYNSLKMTPEERAIDYVKKALIKDAPSGQEIAGRIQNATDSGIPLTLPEATDSLKLMNAQKIISKGTSPGAKVLRNYDEQRFTDTIPQAVQNAIKDISPNTSLDNAGKGAAEAANNAVSAVIKARSEKAAPLYAAAAETNIPPSVSKELAKDPVISSAISSVKGNPYYRKDLATEIKTLSPTATQENKFPIYDQHGSVVNNPAQTQVNDGNLHFFDIVKRALDDKIGSSYRTGENNIARIGQDSKSNLVTALDELSPEYKQARAIFSNDSEGIKKITDDTLGSLVDLNTGNYEKAVPKIFSDTPEGITRSRNLIADQNPQAWNDVLASHMQQNLDKVRDGGFRTFYNNVHGNSLVRQKFEAAMTPEQYTGFSNLMQGLKDSLKVNLSGSDTHFNQASQAEFNNDLGNGLAGAAKSWYNIPGKVADFFDQRSIEKNSEALAKLFTSPNLSSLATDLKGVKPNSTEYFDKIGKFIANESPALITSATAPNYQTAQ